MLNWLKKCVIPHKENDYKPHILRIHAFLLFLSVIVFVEIVFLVQAFVVLTKMDNLSAVLSGVIIEKTNENRAADGLGVLKQSYLLAKAAQLKADDMARYGYFAHNSPSGITPWYWFGKAGYEYIFAGENLAVSFFDSQDVIDAWMNSTGHRENILNGSFTEVGIGISKGKYEGKETIFVVQMFGRPTVATILTEEKVSRVAALNKTETKNIAEVKTETKTSGVADRPVATTAPIADVVKISAIEPIVAGATADKQIAEDKKESIVVAANPIKISTMDVVVSSPRAVEKVLHMTILSIVILALFLNIFIKIRIQHPPLIINGVILLIIISSFLVLNQYLLNSAAKIV